MVKVELVNTNTDKVLKTMSKNIIKPLDDDEAFANFEIVSKEELVSKRKYIGQGYYEGDDLTKNKAEPEAQMLPYSSKMKKKVPKKNWMLIGLMGIGIIAIMVTFEPQLKEGLFAIVAIFVGVFIWNLIWSEIFSANHPEVEEMTPYVPGDEFLYIDDGSQDHI